MIASLASYRGVRLCRIAKFSSIGVRESQWRAIRRTTLSEGLPGSSLVELVLPAGDDDGSD
jgi:hypothetical protein